MARRLDRRRADTGESLLEILMAVAILGIAFAAVLAGIGTTVMTSGINNAQARETSDVRAIAERIQQEPFLPCRSAASYETAVRTSLPTAAFELAVRYSADGSTWVAQASCPATTQLHELAVTIVAADPRAAAPQPLVVYKRKP